MECERCGTESERIQKHHESYLPVVIVKLCPKCHRNVDKTQHNGRFARIRYSRKGILFPSNSNHMKYGYDEKRDKSFPMFRELTEKEKLIRKEIIKNEKQP